MSADGRLVVDTAKGIAALDGIVQHLTPYEWGALSLIAGERGGIVSMARISKRLFNGMTLYERNRTTTVMTRLRAKIGAGFIETHYRRGYRFI